MKWMVIVLCLIGVVGCGERPHSTWKNKYSGFVFEMNSENREYPIMVEFSIYDLERLSHFVYSLAECKGSYQIEGVYSRTGLPYISIEKCDVVAPRTQMTNEFSDGYFCNRCLEYRREELRKKLESLEE